MASVPVITVGKILDAQLMSEVVERGEVDGVVIGRALLADEEFVRKAMDERYDRVRAAASAVSENRQSVIRQPV